MPILDIEGEATVGVGKEIKLEAIGEHLEEAITWETSDASVATVVDGKVVGVKAGTVTITAKSGLAVATKEMLIKHFYVPIDEYDVVIGYRADDSYFSFARDFVSNSISLEQLENAMKLGKLGEQVVLISKKAFDNLVFITHEVVDHREYYAKRVKRDAEARNEYSTLKDTGVIDGVYAIDVLREKENG